MTAREKEVLELRMQNYTFKEIGQRLQNYKTGKMGVTVAGVRGAYISALTKLKFIEEKAAKAKKRAEMVEYCRAVCRVIQENMVFIKTET